MSGHHRNIGRRRTAVTDGVRFTVRVVDRGSGAVRAVLPATRTYAWPTWEVPAWHERLKAAYFALREVWGAW